MNLVEKDKQYVLNLYKRIDIEIDRGEGSYLYDVDGNKYLDMYSGISVNNLGHLNKTLSDIIAKQAKRFMHLSNYFACESTVNLAKILVENTFASKVFFSNSGTEANEAAIKLARKFGSKYSDSKNVILTASNSFHGRSCGSLTLTARDKYKNDFLPLLPRVKNFIYNDTNDLKALVNDDVCAVFLETVQGEGGIVEISQEFIDELMKLSKQYNFLVIIDDIQAGIGRTGDFLSFEKYGIKPHVTTLAKSLGGGLPLGAMLVSEEVEDVLKPGDHGSTFGGNPVACAAGEYVVSNIADSKFLNQVKRKGNIMISGLNELKTKYPLVIKDVRGRGLMIGVDAGQYAQSIKNTALELGLMLNVTNDTVIRILPSLNINTKEIEEFLEKFEMTINSIKTAR